MFIFTKNTPEVDKLPKDHKEGLFEMLKKGPTFLAKLRHPKILTLHHTVEESRYDSSKDLAFTSQINHAYFRMAKKNEQNVQAFNGEKT